MEATLEVVEAAEDGAKLTYELEGDRTKTALTYVSARRTIRACTSSWLVSPAVRATFHSTTPGPPNSKKKPAATEVTAVLLAETKVRAIFH